MNFCAYRLVEQGETMRKRKKLCQKGLAPSRDGADHEAVTGSRIGKRTCLCAGCG